MKKRKSGLRLKEPIPTDAFGKVLWDFYIAKPDEMNVMIERDDYYVSTDAEIEQYFDTVRKWKQCEKDAIKYAKGKVLDVGCGAGRHSLYLQLKGLDVLGIDNSPLAVKTAKARGVIKVRLLSIDSVENLLPKKFDTILMYGNNFGLLRDPDTAKNLLKKLDRITNDDANIIAETLDPYPHSDDFPPEHIEYHKLNKKRCRPGGQITMRYRYKKMIGSWFDYLFVSPAELKDLLNDTPWKIKKLYSEIKKHHGTYTMVLVKRN